MIAYLFHRPAVILVTWVNKVKFSDETDTETKFVQAINDSIHKGIKDLDDTKCNMFVDDSLFAQIRSKIKHVMAASIIA